jgi:hypothetical protein
MTREIFVVGLALLLGSCATIVKGTDQTISLDTPGHEGAQCNLTSKGIGSRTVTTPAIVSLPKSRHDITVHCTKGCFKGQGIISSDIAGATAGNLILGGVVGLGVDAASGAMNKYNEQNQIAMTKTDNCES